MFIFAHPRRLDCLHELVILECAAFLRNVCEVNCCAQRRREWLLSAALSCCGIVSDQIRSVSLVLTVMRVPDTVPVNVW